MSYSGSSGPAEASTSRSQVHFANPSVNTHEAEESEEEEDEDVTMSNAQSYTSTKAATTAGTAATSSPYTSAFKAGTYPTATPGASGSGTSGTQPYVPLSYSNSFLSTTPGSFSFIRSEGVGENYTSGGDLGYGAAVSGGGDGDDEFIPAMAEDDYSALLSWQKQSKDDLKVLMDSLSSEQYERFEAYRRHALNKNAVKKVIQQGLGQQASPSVCQVVAGVAKVFVGEMVERARAVQARRRETGPLSPDHLREAYRMYQDEFGRVGVAQRVRGKKLFVR